MAQYIDKSALIAEIEELMKKYSEFPTRNNYEEGLKDGRHIGYKDALDKINSLEVKELDLEKKKDSYVKLRKDTFISICQAILDGDNDD